MSPSTSDALNVFLCKSTVVDLQGCIVKMKYVLAVGNSTKVKNGSKC